MYCIIRKTYLNELVEEINRRLKDGWELQGGVTTDKYDNYLQALYIKVNK